MQKKVTELVDRVGFMFIATADNNGIPHLACARKLEVVDKEHLAVLEWFCPITVRNLKQNAHLSLVVWEHQSDSGFQLLCELKEMQDTMMINGYSEEEQSRAAFPQVERKLVVKVLSVSEFTQAPHSDRGLRP